MGIKFMLGTILVTLQVAIYLAIAVGYWAVRYLRHDRRKAAVRHALAWPLIFGAVLAEYVEDHLSDEVKK